MAKTLDDLQTLLTGHGYACEQMLDVILATRLETKTYKNPAGENTLEILLTFDKLNDCVAVEVLRAFDLKAAKHREATLACLMAASFRTPLLRPSLDPADGEIRLRVDCQCGDQGASDRHVLTALELLRSFVEAWHPQVDSAMHKGKFDPNKVAHINLSRIGLSQTNLSQTNASQTNASQVDAHPTSTPDVAEQDAEADAPHGPSIGSLMRAAAISAKPGGHANRLKALAEFRRWLDQRGGDCERN
jgi:hypothetical protein